MRGGVAVSTAPLWHAENMSRAVDVVRRLVVAGAVLWLGGMLFYGILTNPTMPWPERVPFLIGGVLFLLYAMPEWVLPNPTGKAETVGGIAGDTLIAFIAFGSAWAFVTEGEGARALRTALTVTAVLAGTWAVRSVVRRTRTVRQFR